MGGECYVEATAKVDGDMHVTRLSSCFNSRVRFACHLS